MNPPRRSRPLILFVHGAWHGSWCWDGVREQLRADGWTTRVLELPSVVRSDERSGLHDDARVVQQTIDDIDQPVVVVAHSYGGMPATQGVAESPNVVHIVYLAAFMLDVGQSVLDAVGGHVPPWWDVDEGTVTPRQPHEVFFNDVPLDVAERAAARLRPHSLDAFTEQLSAAAWRSTPTTYVVCEQDRAIPVAAQDSMSRSASSVVRISSGHSPYLSREAELAQLIAEVSGAEQHPCEVAD